MTDISHLNHGQSLTPEQVRLLPDGAVVRMHKSDRPYLELTVKNGELDIPNCSYNDMQPKGWFALPLATYRWESCVLVSLPQPAESEDVFNLIAAQRGEG